MLKGTFKCKKTLFINDCGEKRAFIIKGRYYSIEEQEVIYTSHDPENQEKEKDFATEFEYLQKTLGDPLEYKYEIAGECDSGTNLKGERIHRRMYITACPEFIEKYFYYKFKN